MKFEELYPLIGRLVLWSNPQYFSKPVVMELSGVTVRRNKITHKYYLSVELTDKSGTVYIGKAEQVEVWR